MEDLISVSVHQRHNSSPSHGQQVFPVLDATSPSLNSNHIPNEEFNYKSFTINYAKRLIDPQCEQGNAANTCGSVNTWRIHRTTLFNNDKMIVKEWFDTLTKILNGEKFTCFGNLMTLNDFSS